MNDQATMHVGPLGSAIHVLTFYVGERADGYQAALMGSS